MSEQPRIAPERPDLVWFSGADSLRFLDDLVSQEIEDIAPGQTRRSFLLEPQGKLAFLLRVLRESDRIGLLTDPGRGEALAMALGRYRIRVEVDIESESRDRWIVVGKWKDGYDISWANVDRFLVIGDRPDLPAVSDIEYEALRILAGEPLWGVDVDEGTIPQESGLVPVSIDFDKGCFLGQELVARIDSRGGNTPRHLRLLEADGDIGSGDPVRSEGVEVGRVTSAQAGAALAMLKRSVGVGDTVRVGDHEAKVRELPVKTAR